MKYGDINGDSSVNALDFAYYRKYLLGFLIAFPSPTGYSGVTAADVNGDGNTNSIDFAYIRSYLLGNIKFFPVENAYDIINYYRQKVRNEYSGSNANLILNSYTALENWVTNYINQYGDSSSLTNRMKSVCYAQYWYDCKVGHDGFTYFNSADGGGEDCANFVSQALSQVFSTDSIWHYYEAYLGGDIIRHIIETPAWLRPGELTEYLISKGNYEYIINGATGRKDAIKRLAKSGIIKPGDVCVLMTSHATIITKVDTINGILYYSAHSEARLNRDLSVIYDDPDYQGNLHIIQMNY